MTAYERYMDYYFEIYLPVVKEHKRLGELAMDETHKNNGKLQRTPKPSWPPAWVGW